MGKSLRSYVIASRILSLAVAPQEARLAHLCGDAVWEGRARAKLGTVTRRAPLHPVCVCVCAREPPSPTIRLKWI